MTKINQTLYAQMTVRMTPDQYDKLEALSKRTGKTKSELMREAVDERLKRR